LYCSNFNQVKTLVDVLRLSGKVADIFLIDNSPAKNTDFETLPAIYIFNNKNIGYGAGHNIAIRKTLQTTDVEYHLVVNPDIEFAPEILAKIESFMNKNTEIAQLMPKIFYPDGKIQYLCKLLPTPSDLIFRRFLPSYFAKKRRERFEMRLSDYDKTMDVPYLSGCFMFLRISALRQIGIFDERFFMYPEDIDLTRRIHKQFRTVFYPQVSVIHNHAQESYKTNKMLFIHIINIIKYFNKWGWFFDKERTIINKSLINTYLT
jgi:GT2 family glycosyltransferase